MIRVTFNVAYIHSGKLIQNMECLFAGLRETDEQLSGVHYDRCLFYSDDIRFWLTQTGKELRGILTKLHN